MGINLIDLRLIVAIALLASKSRQMKGENALVGKLLPRAVYYHYRLQGV